MRAAPEIFKPYDIRGVVPDQLDAEAAEQVGRAFAAEVKPRTAVVGRDVRLTGPEFRDAVVTGLTKSGVNVVDIGQASTDEFYFACGSKELPGIMVTASHNPPEYNGFKMIANIPHFVLAKEFRPKVTDETYPDASTVGTVTEESVTEVFIAKMLKLVPPDTIKPIKVVIDTSNGTQGPVWKRLAKRLPIEMIELCFEPDGNFPNHLNDVIQPESQEMLRAKVKETGADLGLIFDPDGDRCLAVDDRGVSVPGGWLTALLGVAQLERTPGATIIYDVTCSDAVPDSVKAAGGTPLVSKPGHVYIAHAMEERGVPFGGEKSGHFYFEDFWFIDCGSLAALTMLQYVSQLDGPLSAKVKEFESKYFESGEINSKVADREAVIARVKEKYADAIENEISGVAIRYPDWHFVVRPSDTEPVVRLTLEADSPELMETKRDEVLKIIRS